MFKGKKAIELSVNFLVIIILSLVIFGLGVYFIQLIFSGAEEIHKKIDDQTQERIFNLLDSGQTVAIPYATATVRRGTEKVFGVGIRNTDNSDANFAMEVNPSGGGYYQYLSSTHIDGDFYLAPNEKQVQLVIISVDKEAEPGNYAFVVKVKKNDEYLPFVSQLRVNVVE